MRDYKDDPVTVSEAMANLFSRKDARHTLAIIGSHPRTREEFDFSRTDADIWMFNEAISGKGNVWAKRADVIFQLHIPAIWKNPKNRNDPGHFDWLKSQYEIPVYMQEDYP